MKRWSVYHDGIPYEDENGRWVEYSEVKALLRSLRKKYQKAPKIESCVKEKTPEELETCPSCGKGSVRAKGILRGGGVECTNPECDYWHCF